MPALDLGGDTNTGDHLCIRNMSADGGGGHRAAWSTYCAMIGTSGNPLNEIVFDNSEITRMGSIDYAINTAEEDYHGLRPGPYATNVWVTRVHGHLNAGDAMQVNGNNATGEARNRYLHIYDCLFENNGENALDIKSGRDIFVLRNNFRGYGNAKGSDGTALVVQQEGGSGSSNIWAAFNSISDCVRPIRVIEASTQCYGIGNLFFDLKDGNAESPAIDGYSGAMTQGSACELALVDNTFVRYASNGTRWKGQSSLSPTYTLSGNLFHERSNGSGWEVWGLLNAGGPISINRNLYPLSSRFFYSIDYTSLASWKIGNPGGWDANSLSAAPGLVSPETDDFRITGSSVAVNANTESSVYATYLTRYGRSIKYDYAGNARPVGAGWDIGAYEFVGTPGSISVLETETLNTTTLNIGP